MGAPIRRDAFQRDRYRRRGMPLMVGRPAANQPARGPAPQIELTLEDEAALQAIPDAGPAGAAIGADLKVSRAIRLGLIGLVAIDLASPDGTTPQRVRLKRMGGGA